MRCDASSGGWSEAVGKGQPSGMGAGVTGYSRIQLVNMRHGHELSGRGSATTTPRPIKTLAALGSKPEKEDVHPC